MQIVESLGYHDDDDDMEGFWSSLKKGFKKAAKITGRVPGLNFAAKGILKVGGAVVKTKSLRRLLQAASVPFTGPLGPAALEVGAHLLAKSSKRKVAGKSGVPERKAIKLLRRLTLLGPERARMAADLVKCGVSATRATQIVAPDKMPPPGCRCPKPGRKERERIATVAAAELGRVGAFDGLDQALVVPEDAASNRPFGWSS